MLQPAARRTHDHLSNATLPSDRAGGSRRAGLRAMSYAEGAAALSPRNDALVADARVSTHNAYSAGKSLGPIDVVMLQGKPVEKKTAAAFERMRDAAAKDGVHLQLNSGFRSMEEQQHLYNLYKSGRGNLAAYPGHSNHQSGIAVDINVVSDAAYNWMHKHGPSFGFRRTVPSEPWHWEYLPR